jgi:hypothetical protein
MKIFAFKSQCTFIALLVINLSAWSQMSTMPAINANELNQINSQPLSPEISVSQPPNAISPETNNRDLYETKVLEQNINGDNPSNPLSEEAPNLTGQGNILTKPF